MGLRKWNKPPLCLLPQWGGDPIRRGGEESLWGGFLSMGKSHDQSDGESVEHVSSQLRQAGCWAALVIPRHGVVFHNQNRYQQHHYDAVEAAQKQSGQSIEWQR